VPFPPPALVTDSARTTLSRWRHGFEPRWDYTEKRRSEALSSLKRRLSSPVRPAFVPRPTPTRRQSQRGRPGRLGRPTRSAAVELFESARSRRDSALHERIGTLAKTRLSAVLWAGAGSDSGRPKRATTEPTADRAGHCPPLLALLVVAHSLGDEFDIDPIREPHVWTLVDDRSIVLRPDLGGGRLSPLRGRQSAA
jgi:hypothetical protein